MQDPIVILMTGRCGSSMVAGIFAKHDVWVGRQLGNVYKTGDYENREIKALIKGEMGWDFMEPVRAFPKVRKKIERIVKDQGYSKGPWLFKQGAQYYRLWDEWRPKFIFVRRPIDDILASFDRCGWLKGRHSPEEIRWIVERNIEIMDSLEGFDVHSDAIMNGDYSSLKKAFEYCGLEFDPKIADGFIDPEAWHA